MMRAGSSLQNSWTAAVPLGVTPRGRTHLVDLIWLAEPSLDERTHLAGTGSRRLGKPRVRAPNGNSMTAETMVPAVELLVQALVPDGRERTTVRTILDILSVLKSPHKVRF